MFKKIMVFGVLALGVASAESYRIKLFQPSVLKGTQLKAGEYRFNVENDKVTVTAGKQTVEAPVKVETSDTKFSQTAVRYSGENTISEIRVGGTKTRLVFSN